MTHDHVQYARTQIKTAPMYDENVAAKVAEQFQGGMALVEEKCGRFVRGKHVGSLRGWAHFEIVVEGGWSRERGCVLLPGQLIRLDVSDFNGKRYLEWRYQ